MSKPIDKILKNLEPKPFQKFHSSTKLKSFSKKTDPKDWPDSWKKTYFKGYPRLPEVELPDPNLSERYTLNKALFNRASSRDFSTTPVGVESVSTLLYYSCNVRKSDPTWNANRFYPSAGSRYPLEVYPVILNSDGIQEGVYHYYIKRHSLEVLLKKRFKRQLFTSFNSDWIKKAGLILLISAVFPRTEVKYGSRGYRHVLTEVGHLTQNIYLISAALKLSCCSVGGYKDDKLNELLDLDGLEETVVGVTVVGKT